MSEREPDYSLAIVLTIVMLLLLAVLLLADSFVQDSEIEDLQRRVGQLESERR